MKGKIKTSYSNNGNAIPGSNKYTLLLIVQNDANFVDFLSEHHLRYIYYFNPLTLLATLSSKGSRRPISLMRTHKPQYPRSEYHTQLAKMSFDEIFDLTAGVYFYFTLCRLFST